MSKFGDNRIVRLLPTGNGSGTDALKGTDQYLYAAFAIFAEGLVVAAPMPKLVVTPPVQPLHSTMLLRS